MSSIAQPVRTSVAPVRSVAPSSAPTSGVALDPIRLLKKYYPLLIASAVIGAVLGGAAHFVLARVSPQYTAFATFQCIPETTSALAVGQGVISQDELMRFMGTQMAIITSTPILERVLRDATVEQTSWAQQYFVGGRLNTLVAQPELEKALTTRAVPQSSLFRVSMTWRNPQDVQTIVAAVTRVYQEDQRSNAQSTSVARRDVLSKQITSVDSAIKDLNNSRDRLLESGNVTDLDAGIATEDVRVARLSEQLVGSKSSQANLLSQFSSMEKMSQADGVIQYSDELRESANRDPVVAGMDSQMANMRAEVQAMMAEGYGKEHETIRMMEHRIKAIGREREDSYNRALRKLFDSRKDEIRTAADGLAASIQQLEKDLEEVQKRKQELVKLRIRLKDIDDQVNRLTEERNQADEALKAITLVMSNSVFDRVRLLVPAQEPKQMSFPRLVIMVPMGVVLIAGLTGALVLLREILDQRVRGPADLSTMARLRLLGIVPDAQEDPTKPASLGTAFRDAPAGITSESFRVLRSPIVKAMDSGGHKTLLVLAGMPGSGASTVASNLALACAGVGERVLLIDANMRRPALHKVYGLSEGPGLGDVLAGSGSFADVARATSVTNVSVVTAGTMANRALPERLAGETMARVLAEASEKYDRVIVDSAPAIVAGDGFALANRVDAVVMVVRAMCEKRGLVNRLRGQLGECRGEFLGVIVNAVRASAGGYLRGNIKATHEYHRADAA